MNTSVLVRSAEALADDLGAVDDRDKGTRIDFARIAAQLHGLATAQHAHDHRHALAREGTVAAADGRRAVEMLDDKLLDLKGLGTNDRADFAQVNALNGFVDHKRLGKQAEHAIQTDTRAIQKGRDGHDADIDQQQCATNLERRAEAEAVGAKLDGLTVVLISQAGEAGQLYGSVSARDIAAGSA